MIHLTLTKFLKFSTIFCFSNKKYLRRMAEIKTKGKNYNFNKVNVMDGHGEIFNFYELD